jgi:hypothetical protein
MWCPLFGRFTNVKKDKDIKSFSKIILVACLLKMKSDFYNGLE